MERYWMIILALALTVFRNSSNAQSTCSTALTIGAGTHQVAGFSESEPLATICTVLQSTGTGAAWYRYTTPETRSVTVSSAISLMDTRVHILTGDCGSLVCLTGDDDTGPSNSSIVTFNAEPGIEYMIVWDNIWGSFAFDFELIDGPPIDQVAEPVTFTTVPVPPGMGVVMVVVDMDGDHLDDLVSPSSTSIKIGKQQTDGSFIVQSASFPQTNNNPSWSVAAGDLDNNGFTDLLYGGSGPTLMLASDDGSAFTEWTNDTYIFAQRTNMVDIDNDGNLDGFYCHDISANVYYFSDGQGGFTEASGELSQTSGNYGSIWIDFDNDGDVDMFNTKCGGGGGIDALFRNDGNGQFTDVAPEMGFADAHSAWSTAWGDFDNDGDMDAFVGKSGGQQHKLMRNDGNIFTNITIGSGTEGASGSIEWRTYDFNNDGLLDILSPSQILYNAGGMTFELAGNVPFGGPIGDLNDDGFLDVVNWTIQLNNGNDNHWFKVSLVGTVSNRMGIGARVTITTPQGQQVRDIVSGDGFKYMSTVNAHFGLGAVTEILAVEVRWPSGIVDVIEAPIIDDRLVVVEGLSTGLADAAVVPRLAVFPDPTTDRLWMQGITNGTVYVLDMMGKLLLSGRIDAAGVDVTALASGRYVVVVEDDRGRKQALFTKL